LRRKGGDVPLDELDLGLGLNGLGVEVREDEETEAKYLMLHLPGTLTTDALRTKYSVLTLLVRKRYVLDSLALQVKTEAKYLPLTLSRTGSGSRRRERKKMRNILRSNLTSLTGYTRVLVGCNM